MNFRKNIIDNSKNVDLNFSEEYVYVPINVLPLEGNVWILEEAFYKDGGLSSDVLVVRQEVSVAFEPETGGIEVIPGCVFYDMKDHDIGREPKQRDVVYFVDTETNRKRWLNRKTVAINIDGGHTIVYQVKGNEVDVVFEGYLEQALEGSVWERGKYPFPATSKVIHCIENFPSEIGSVNGLDALMNEYYKCIAKRT